MKALITGATKGIGRAISNRLAMENIHLILNSRNSIELESVKSEILEKNSGIEILCYTADLSIRDQTFKLAENISSFSPDVNILVNNVGLYLPSNIEDAADDILEKLMETNLYSAYHLTRKLLSTLKQNEKAYIFNICSIAGLQPYPGGSNYCITKYAMNGFSQCLREELKKDNVAVCTIYPGATWSDSWKGSNLPSARIMQAEDIAEIVATQLKLSKSAVMEEIVLRPQLGDL